MTNENQPAEVNPRLVRPPGWSPKLHLDLAKMPDDQRRKQVLLGLGTFVGIGALAEKRYHFYTNKQADPWVRRNYKWTPWTAQGIALERTTTESLEELVPYVPDEEILEVCEALVKRRQLLDDINGQLGQALADFLGLPAPGTEEDFEVLLQEVEVYRLEHGPAWMSEAEIQPLILNLKDLFVEIRSLEFELIARLEQYLVEPTTVSPEEMGDERAKDLVDQAEGADAKTAIRLLKKALHYGKTGIQASKAYMELGGRYSDLGEPEKAIEHYTKSIEAYKEPNAFALYWRGELYYQQEEWAKARSDFEQAVAIGLSSPEYEQAQEYLSDLGARESGE
jgi:tetratricopeptide (TPR) repeat protein